PDTHLLLGRIAGEQGDHAAAEQHLRRYVRLQPEDPQGLGELGVVLLAREKSQEAEAFLKRVLEIDPESEPAHHNLGLLYSRRGEHERAREHLEAVT
ncbi:tetratricopeptide repeat protein, partial [Acidobacteriia bacterium AH_259_A11_L15]|nr:tetratricopeptide repeat protein [Acidobacteriia bacterium AH_259_A11_L15]